MRRVFDTNVYISAFVVPGSKSELAFSLAERHRFELVVSPEILTELEDKLVSRFEYSVEIAAEVRRDVSEVAIAVELQLELCVLDDEPDNRVLECTAASGAVAIVTGDKELLAVGNYDGIGVMTVAELLYSFPE